MAEKGCKYCGKPIAWRKVMLPGGNPRGDNRPFEPVRDEAGQIVRKTVPNGSYGPGPRQGQPKFACRIVPSTVMHLCRTHSPAPEWTPAPDETPLPYGHGSDCPQDVPGPAPEAPREPEAPLPYTQGPTPSTIDLAALAALLAGPVTETVRGEIVALLKSYGVEPPPQRHSFTGPRGEFQTEPGEIMHAQVPRVVDYVGRGKHVYAWGEAGGGKTHGMAQAARLAGRETIVIPFAGMSPGRLFGHSTVSGEWQRGLICDAIERGLVVIADEFDRALPQVAVTLNCVLENGFFMDGTKQVQVNPAFVMLATGNTDGRGATRKATSAQPMDAPTLARFRRVEWTYDEAQEMALVRKHLAEDEATRLVAWSKSVRRVIERDHIESFVCGPRESRNVAEDVAAGVPVKDAVESLVFAGLKPRETVTRILHECPLPRIGEGK